MRFTLLLFLAFSLTNAQDFSETEVFFSNGKTIKGYGKPNFKGFTFKKDIDGRTINYKHLGIDSIQLFRGDSTVTYQFKKDKQNVYLMTVLESGDATLLRNYISGTTYSSSFGLQSVGGVMYYVSKNGEFEAKRIFTEGAVLDNNFRKTMSKIFKSCPSLIEKLENKEYRKKDIREVVRYFNQHCSY